MKSLRLLLLGPPRIERDDQILEVDTRKATALLAYLALSGERPSRDWLAAFLWPEFDDRRAKAALCRTLSALKTAVGAGAIFANREVIGLEADLWCDVIAFQQALRQGNLAAAIELYRDDFLAGFSLRDSLPFDDWQLVTAQTLRRELETALEKLVNQVSALGNWGRSLTLAHRWLALDPLREEVHCQLMRIYTALGQPNAALRQYRDCVRILEEELSVPPLPETTAIYQAIQENRLTAVPPAAPSLPLSPAPLPLVGRAAELAQMRQVYRQIEAGGRFLAVTGEMGVGKSRLAEDFLAWAQGQGARILTARCYEGESSLAYAPIVQLLRDGLALAETAAHWRH